jgi:hypothetical protein
MSGLPNEQSCWVQTNEDAPFCDAMVALIAEIEAMGGSGDSGIRSRGV